MTTVPTLVYRPSDGPPAMHSIPTAPRLKSMLLEPIYIPKWAEALPAGLSPVYNPIIEDGFEQALGAFPAPPWTARGSLIPYDAFHAIFRDKSPWHAGLAANSIDSRLSLSISDSLEFGLSPMPRQNDLGTSARDIFGDGERPAMRDGERPHLVPTIMISNSTAALPISLESSQSLTRDVPLAVRRGRNVPPPLAIGKIRLSNPKQDPYPDIPSAFLGSPSSYSPTFEYSAESPTPSMGLEAMCADLRSRCPEVRAPTSPTRMDHSDKNTLNNPLPRSSSDAESDEWDFAKDLLEVYSQRPSTPDGRLSPVPGSVNAPSDTIPSPDCSTTADVDSFSWASTPTFADSTEHNEDSPPPEIEDLRTQRRKTVIIETGNRASTSLRPDGSAPHNDESDRPVPFEVSAGSCFSPAGCHQSTPPPWSRPASTATVRPVRGILKEKKTVRFSVAPSMHEYLSEDHHEQSGASPRGTSEPIKRGSAAVQQPSALRQSFTPGGNAVPVDAPVEQAEPKRPTFPKHPAVRAAAQRASRPASVEAPAPAAASPASPERAPLRPANGRQSLPPARAPQSAAGRRSVVKAEVGTPKRLMKTASASLPARPADQCVTPVSSGGRARRDSSAQKSRMPVPFRTILTKFRA
ncbi:hypothetical protein CERSUDRAFT_93175 [Gelatoporia subvermispora B]|uniref:Uncharacterized protein n=1 Tax=Ceriporiopsis subvermispora (strain B) TaxID=914234 RepID=M2RKY1_CERS8|nr:hypothetical protein CERSUDRAFT_93175 [Gelatoporia subvermispora B]